MLSSRKEMLSWFLSSCHSRKKKSKKKSCSLGWVCQVKFCFFGAHPQPRTRRVHPTKKGYFLSELNRVKQTKDDSWGGFAWINFGGSPLNQSPQVPPKQIGVFALRIGLGASKQKLLLRARLHYKFYFCSSPPTQMGVFALKIGWGPAKKSCSLESVCLLKLIFWGSLL